MRVLTTALILFGAACAGPGQAKLADTPTAHSKANTGLAPPASQSDEDRAEVVDSFDQMGAGQRARKEATETTSTTPAPKPVPAGTPGKAKPTTTPASPEKPN
jgi:hypothetical protein